MYYIENSSTGAPFQMRQVEEICFLEYTSPSNLETPSLNGKYTTNPSTVFVTKTDVTSPYYAKHFIPFNLAHLMPGSTIWK